MGWAASSSPPQASGCTGWRRPENCDPAQIRLVLVLEDHMPGAAQGGPSILVDGELPVGGQLSLAGSLLQNNHHTIAFGPTTAGLRESAYGR